MGHEVPTALLPSFLAATVGAPAAALGVIKGVADGLAGAARLGGGALADDPGRAAGDHGRCYTSTAVLFGLIAPSARPARIAVRCPASWAG